MTVFLTVLVTLGTLSLITFLIAVGHVLGMRSGFVTGYFTGRTDELEVESIRWSRVTEGNELSPEEAHQIMQQQIESHQLLKDHTEGAWDGIDRLSIYQ